MNTPQVQVASVAELARSLATSFATACRCAIDARGSAHVAVTGGSLLKHFGSALADAGVEWARVHVYFGDERAVPPTHPESNYRLARVAWLDRVDVPVSQVHRMLADLDDLEEGATRYEDTLRNHLGATHRLDLALLGVGPDGHVCSLFPGHAALSGRDRLVAAVYDSPKPPARRLTLTLPMLEAARSVTAVAMGADKAAAIRDGLNGPHADHPLAHVVRGASSVLFLLDPDAASLLET